MTLKIKVTVTTKRPLSNLPNKLFDKTILQNYFLNCFSYKVWEKSLLGWKHVLRKRLKKTQQIVVPMHHFAIKLPMKPPGYCQKDQTWSKITFLHENTTFIKTFAMGFINKLEFWDFNLFRHRSKTALTANSIDQTSSIMDLKFNHYLELYNTDLKIYS